MDEVSFRAPELGPLSALLVGPEAGRWVCEEVDVSSSRTGHTDRCVWDAGFNLAATLQQNCRLGVAVQELLCVFAACCLLYPVLVLQAC